MGKYADYPVSYFTGVPAINIPLYTLKDGAATLPISLSYHASGIKVGEVASSVGLGWVLNAGGVITRTIKGVPDEGSKNDGDGPKGYYKDSGLTKFPALDTASSSSKIRKMIDNMVDNNCLDGEPDIYTFNVDGMVGKFIFDENRHPKFLTQSDVRISVDYSGGEFSRWTITPPNGVQYIFDSKESSGIYGSTNADNYAPTSWYLTKVIYPNSTDTLNFLYDYRGDAYFILGSEFTTEEDSSSLASKVPDGGYIECQGSRRLSKITSKNIEIRFDYAYPYRYIDIVDKNTDKVIDKVRFNYDYFTSTRDGSLELAAKNLRDTSRVKLVSLQKGLQRSTIQLPIYKFEYYEDVKLPRRCSYDVDHWGYANNYGGHNNRFTPDTKTSLKITGLTVTPPLGGQYREPRWPNTRAFSLKKITDPAGVSTMFEFEPNTITKDTVGGGMRIKQITVEDPVSKQKYIRRFDYSLDSNRSSGILFRKPAYWTEILNEYTPSGTKYVGDNASNTELSTKLFCKYSQSPLPLQDYQGYSVGYTQVKEYFSSDTANGYIVYSYQAKPKPTTTSRLQASNYITSGFPNGKWNDITPENLKYANPNTRGKLFPFEPLQTDLYNWLLTKQETFNQAGKLLQSTTYSYDDNYADNNWFRGFLATRIAYKAGGYAYPFTYYKYRTARVKLISKKHTLVDSITGKNIVNETKYVYESPNHLQPTRQIIINSVGDSIEQVMRYSFDFDSAAITGGVIPEMKSQNILTPLRVEAWKNNTLISCSSTEYAKNSMGTRATVVPIKTYTLENAKVLSATDVGFNKSFNNNIPNLNGSTSLMKLQSFSSYNNFGLPKQQGKTNDIPASYIYDYNNTLMIAVANNATPEDIAYTSFEADGAGNWTITSRDRNTNTSVTGTKSYDIAKGNITKAGLNNSKVYWLNYWAKTDANITVTNTTQTIQRPTKNGYIFWTKKINGATSITISGTGTIDELRLYPEGSQMTNYTYQLGVGILSKSSGINMAFYEYDEVNRLSTVRDADKNIVQQYCYSSAGKPINCSGTVFRNKEMSQVFEKQGCIPSYTYGIPSYIGEKVTYTVPQGKYTSFVSQAAADNRAQWDIEDNGQNYANEKGKCVTTYCLLVRKNFSYYQDNYIRGDAVLYFYEDKECTIPKSYYYGNLSYTKNYGRTGEVPQSTREVADCKGTSVFLESNVIFYLMYGPDTTPSLWPPRDGDQEYCFYTIDSQDGLTFLGAIDEP